MGQRHLNPAAKSLSLQEPPPQPSTAHLSACGGQGPCHVPAPLQDTYSLVLRVCFQCPAEAGSSTHWPPPWTGQGQTQQTSSFVSPLALEKLFPTKPYCLRDTDLRMECMENYCCVCTTQSVRKTSEKSRSLPRATHRTPTWEPTPPPGRREPPHSTGHLHRVQELATGRHNPKDHGGEATSPLPKPG